MRRFCLLEKRKNKEPKMMAKIRVRNHDVQYNKEATRWLGVWLDGMLTLNDHMKKIFAKARRAQNRVRSLIMTKGFNSKGWQ